MIDVATHTKLCDLLPEPGRLEKIEVMLGPEHVDMHPELRDRVRSQD